MQQKTISIVTLGCPKNQVDSEFLANSVKSDIVKIAHSSDYADTIMINTCGFILDAKEQSIETILDYVQAKREGKVQEIIVFGCLSERYGSELQKEIPEVDFWFGVHDVEHIIKHISTKTNTAKVRDHSLLTTPAHFAYLKISEGCDRQCAFCAIPSIRGRHISRPMEDIVDEAIQLVRNGVRELIVIAQDTTYYGIDLYKKQMLPELIDKLAIESGAEWIRIHYTYPASFPLNLIDVIKSHNNICKYIDIPFQHVDDNILSNMKRHHKLEDIEKLISDFRERIPDIHIRSSFITGFPGEGKEEFRKMIRFLKTHQLERVGFFTYSHEEGTPAADMEDNVPHKTKLSRMQRLMKLQEKISFEQNLAKTGQVFEILIDEIHPGYMLGRTEFDSPEIDHLVTVYTNNNHNFSTGDFIKVRITGADAWDLIAEPV